MRTREVADALGVSYRRLDHLTRCGVLDHHRDANGRTFNQGSGTRRAWDPALVVRLALALHAAQLVPYQGGSYGQSLFPTFAAMAVDAPPPPSRGYVVARVDSLTWVATWADVRQHMLEDGGALVVPYDLDELLSPALVDAALATDSDHARG